MKNVSKLLSKIRMPAGDEPAPPKKDAATDADFDPAFEAGADEEAEAAPATPKLADFSDEELQAELDRRGGESEEADPSEEEPDADLDDEEY
jgi:hypothetical protein